MNNAEIIKKLPYSTPFLFVDEILSADINGIVGTFTFNENLDFYKGHFKNNPVTPGVILAECMAQIGLVCLGILLINEEYSTEKSVALSSMEIEFLKPVFPKEKVTVHSEKMYFRFSKLKCKVWMINEKNDVVCEGTIAGFIK